MPAQSHCKVTDKIERFIPGITLDVLFADCIEHFVIVLVNIPHLISERMDHDMIPEFVTGILVGATANLASD